MTEPTVDKPQVEEQRYTSFTEFYPFYLNEHSNPLCRALHYIGSIGVLSIIAYAIATGNYMALWFMPLMGYGFAWVAHFFVEHNRPATFKYPLYSLIGDWVMLKDFFLGRFRR